MSKKSEAILANKAISLKTLVGLLRSFDRKEGQFPEHLFEGKAVGRRMLFQLGFNEKELNAIFGRADFRESELEGRRTFRGKLRQTA